MDAALLEIFYNLQKVAHRPSKAIQPDDDQHVAGFEVSEQPCQNWSRPRCAGALLLKYSLTASGTQLVHLCVMHLIVGRDTRISYKTFRGWRWIGDLPFCHDVLVRISGALYK
jgi:hypothetical protein